MRITSLEEVLIKIVSLLGAVILPIGFIALCYLAVWHLFIKDLKPVKELRKPEKEKRLRREQDKAEMEEIKRQHSARPANARRKTSSQLQPSIAHHKE